MGMLATFGRWLAGDRSPDPHDDEERSLENPRVPLDPWSQVLSDGLDGMTSSAGIRIDRHKALNWAAVWRGVGLISRTVAKLPVSPYAHNRPGKEIDRKHPSYRVLRVSPTRGITPFIWKQLMQSHALVEGNGYSYIMRDGRGDPLELLPLDPHKTWPMRADGKLFYLHDLGGGEYRKLPVEDVIHFKGFGYDGIQGYNFIEIARESIGQGLAIQKYGSIVFKNGARPSIVLEHPAKLSPEAAKTLRESWERIYSGLDNAHRSAVLAEGMRARVLSFNSRDAQLVESKAACLVDVANWLHLPPHKLGSSTNISYASLEQENQAFLDDAIDPWLVSHEEELEAKLLTEEERDADTHCIAFDRFPLVRANLSERGTFYVGMMGIGVLNADEIRGYENLNPIPDGLGQTYYRPANLMPAGEEDDEPADPEVDPEGNPPQVPTPEPEANSRKPMVLALRKIATDTVRRLVRRVGHQGERAAKKPGEFINWIDAMRAEMEEATPEAISGIREACLALGGTVPELDGVSRNLVETMANSLLEVAGLAKDGAALERGVEMWRVKAEQSPLALLKWIPEN